MACFLFANSTEVCLPLSNSSQTGTALEAVSSGQMHTNQLLEIGVILKHYISEEAQLIRIHSRGNLFHQDSPPGATRQTVSAFCNKTLCLWPSTSTSTSSRGLDSIFTRPTKTDRVCPSASTTKTWLPVWSSDRYSVRPPAIPTYAWTGPCCVEHRTLTRHQEILKRNMNVHHLKYLEDWRSELMTELSETEI